MKKKSRKGQVTVFVILAVVIVAAVAGFFVLRGGVSTETVSPAFMPVKTAVDSCLEQSLNDAIYSNSLRGGYFNVPSPKVEYLVMEVPIYLDKAVSHVPTKSNLQEQLALAVNDSMETCLLNSALLENQSYDITPGRRTVKTTINSNNVEASMTWPLTVAKAGETQVISSFNAKSNFNLLEKYNFASQIVDEKKKTPSEIPIGYLTDLAANNNFDIETIDLDPNNTLYTLVFNQTYNEQQFIYVFDVKY